MPWENTDQFIRSGHKSPEEFQPNTLKTIILNEKDGLEAVVGKPLGKDTMEVQSYLFDKTKGWTIEKAKEWFTRHMEANERVFVILPFEIKEKVADRPLKIRGVALTSGISRNLNIYTPQELEAFADKLVGAPMYIEHVAVPNAIGKVTTATWDGQRLMYEAEVLMKKPPTKSAKASSST